MSLSRDDEDDDDDAKSVASAKSAASRTPSTAGLLALRGRIAPEAGKDREMGVGATIGCRSAVLEIRTWSTH